MVFLARRASCVEVSERGGFAIFIRMDEGQTQKLTPETEERLGKKWVFVAAGFLVLVAAVMYALRDRPDANTGAGIDVCASIEMGTATPRYASKIIQDPETGREFVSNNVIVGFKAGVAIADICQLILEQHGRVMQRFTNVPLFLVEVPDEGDGEVARRTVKRFLQSDIVDDAVLNFLDSANRATTTETIGEEIPTGGAR